MHGKNKVGTKVIDQFKIILKVDFILKAGSRCTHIYSNNIQCNYHNLFKTTVDYTCSQYFLSQPTGEARLVLIQGCPDLENKIVNTLFVSIYQKGLSFNSVVVLIYVI